MRKAASTLTLIFFILVSVVAATQFHIVAIAQTFEFITIKSDGSITPQTAHITHVGDIYKLTGDIWGSITVEKFNIIIDGAGHTLQGNGTGRGIQIFNPYNATIKSSYDVTVKKFNIKGFEEGIDVFGYWGNIISGVVITENIVANNNVGIRFSSYARYSNNVIVSNIIVANNEGIAMQMGHVGDESGNTVTSNQIADNQVGMWFLWLGDYYSWKPNPFEMNNRIYNNNFVNNSQNVVNAHVIYDPDCANIWDNDTIGNHWSDYNGTDNNGDGAGDTPYVIDTNNQDYYPLMSPVNVPKPLSSSPPQETESTAKPFPTTLVAVASAIAVVVIGSGLLVYFRKRHPKSGEAT